MPPPLLLIAFQSTHLLRGATLGHSTCISHLMFQSTHPRRVRLRREDEISNFHSVSIHAPMKGATTGSRAGNQLVQVSIHAPMKGATIYMIKLKKINLVSIHAPMKGATYGLHTLTESKIVSIHAPLARCDVPSGGFVYIAYVFQSTHLLRGATAKGHIYSLFCVYRWGYFPTDTVCSY